MYGISTGQGGLDGTRKLLIWHGDRGVGPSRMTVKILPNFSSRSLASVQGGRGVQTRGRGQAAQVPKSKLVNNIEADRTAGRGRPGTALRFQERTGQPGAAGVTTR